MSSLAPPTALMLFCGGRNVEWSLTGVLSEEWWLLLMVSLRFNLNCQNYLLTRSEIHSSSIYFLSGSLGKFICVGDQHREVFWICHENGYPCILKKNNKKKKIPEVTMFINSAQLKTFFFFCFKEVVIGMCRIKKSNSWKEWGLC